MRNINIKALSLVAIALSTNAMAATETNIPKFSLTAGYQHHRMNMPASNMPITYGEDNSTYGNNDLDKTGVTYDRFFPTIEAAFGFDNKGELPGLFGDRYQVAMSFTYFKDSGSDSQTDIPKGFYWDVSGSDVPLNDLTANYIDSSTSSYENRYYDIELKLIGGRQHSERLYVQQRVGLFFRDGLDRFEYNAVGRMTGPVSTSYDLDGKQDLDYYYVGPLIGQKFNFKAHKNINLFLDAEVAVLYIDGKLDAYQSLNHSAPDFQENYSDSSSTVTYKTTLKAGFDVLFNSDKGVYSPKVSFEVGAELWGKYPYIDNPQGQDDSATKIKYKSSFNTFFGVTFSQTIG